METQIQQSKPTIGRVDPVQRIIEEALTIVLIPTVVMMVIHVLTTFITASFSWLMVLHVLFSITLAVFASRSKMEWSQAATAIGSAGFAVGLIGGLIVFLRTFSVVTFFELLTNPFILAALDAAVGGIAILLVPAIMKLYQK